MGTNTTTTVNHGRTRRNFNLVDRIESSTLTPQDKTELLINLTGKRRTLLEGAVFMLKNATIKFDDFERALALLNSANNAGSLSFVEAALQKQIDVIRRMDDMDLTPENKALCLYTLQNMIFALSDFHLGKNQVNDFVPRILQDQYQMLMKGSALNVNWDALNDSTYSAEYCDANNPTLAQWKFLDSNLIQRNMENMSNSSVGDDNSINTKLNLAKRKQVVQVNDDGVISWGTFELESTDDEEINNLLNQALAKFDTTDLKQDLLTIFNIVDDATTQSNQSEAIHGILHKVVLNSMQRIVEIGNNQQKKNLSSTKNLTTSNLDLMSFDLGAIGGGRQMIFVHQPINDSDYYVLTLGCAISNEENQNRDANLSRGEKAKKSAKQLLNNLRNLIPNFNKNNSTPVVAVVQDVRLHCFKLSRTQDSNYQVEEYVTPQSIIDVARIFSIGQNDSEIKQ